MRQEVPECPRVRILRQKADRNKIYHTQKYLPNFVWFAFFRSGDKRILQSSLKTNSRH